MSSEKIQDIVDGFKAELIAIQDSDREGAERLEQLIVLMETGIIEPNGVDRSSLDLAIDLETRLESEHPLVANLLKELVSTLEKMGI